MININGKMIKSQMQKEEDLLFENNVMSDLDFSHLVLGRGLRQHLVQNGFHAIHTLNTLSFPRELIEGD